MCRTGLGIGAGSRAAQEARWFRSGNFLKKFNHIDQADLIRGPSKSISSACTACCIHKPGISQNQQDFG
jgi:hypothetical protein